MSEMGRKSILSAGRIADIPQPALICETTATVFHYAKTHRLDLSEL